MRSALTEAAHSVRGSKNYLGALYRRTASRKEMYVDLGEDYFDKQREASIVRHSLRRLESLGYTISLTQPEAS